MLKTNIRAHGNRLDPVFVSCIVSAMLAACTTTTSETAGENRVTFQDCKNCPVMVELPAGSFLMGTAEGEQMIDSRTGKPVTNDLPQHRVTLAEPFAIGKYEITVGEFREFVTATGHEQQGTCMEFGSGSFKFSKDINWNNTGYAQTDTMPVGCITFFDAVAYTEWLSKITGLNYRLPSEAEWEYAARAGTTTPYFWGNDVADACRYANVRSAGADAISKAQAETDRTEGFACDDGYTHPAPVGSFLPNNFGLHDMQANVWEWVSDCNHKDYVGAPSDGSAWLDAEDCQFGVMRSGSNLNPTQQTGAALRAGRPREGRATNIGFRVVRAQGTPTQQLVTQRTGWQAVGDPNMPAGSGAELYANNCAACHLEQNSFRGIYGQDQTAVETTIRGGGNNTMSMPAFGNRLTDAEISALATYVRQQNGWQD
jgi:formylglycine-generating enzyme required for sulfatase activity